MSISGETNRLKDKVVVLTRPSHQGEDLADQLRLLGAIPLHIPAIKIAPIDDEETRKLALTKLQETDWVIFTSANGVTLFLKLIDIDPAAKNILIRKRIACIGPGTARTLSESLRAPDLVPDEYISDAITASLGDIRGLKVLVPRARQARKTLIENLTEAGAIPCEIPIYDTVSNLDGEMINRIRESARPDLLTFTSSSTVNGFSEIMQIAGRDWLTTTKAVCIGPITAKTLTEHGVIPAKIAEEYSIQGLISSLSTI